MNVKQHLKPSRNDSPPHQCWLCQIRPSLILKTDASKWAVGATLLQKQNDGQIHPCGYLSHALTQTEQNRQIYDRELYTIIYALDEWKYLLLGAEHTHYSLWSQEFNLLQNATTPYSMTGKMVDQSITLQLSINSYTWHKTHTSWCIIMPSWSHPRRRRWQTCHNVTRRSICSSHCHRSLRSDPHPIIKRWIHTRYY